jgi:hypothetical protein
MLIAHMQRSTLIDFNAYLAMRTAGTAPVTDESGQPIRLFNAFQFWNFLDKALSEIRTEAARGGRTPDQQNRFFAR